MIAIKNSMNKEDWNKWRRNIGIFATPLLILFLTALSQGVALKPALYLLYGAVLQALLDLLIRYKSGVVITPPGIGIPPLANQAAPVSTPIVKEPLG